MLRSGLTRLPEVGDRVERYRVVAEIAHGGMAAVFAAQRADAGTFEKVLAIKFLLPHLASERRFVDMFLDEARIAAQIQHPNVVQVFDVAEHRGAPFIVMEYLRGQSLAAVLRHCWIEERALSRETLYFILAEVARGLAGAHDAKDAVGEPLDVVHRDVSPQNVHVGYDGRVRVVDFGVAAAAGRITSTRTGEIKGKIAFLAPEQLHRRHPVDARTDLWAFGVMCWEIFAGERLFRGETDSDTMYNVLHKTIPAIGVIDPELPPELATCIDRCLKRPAIQRPSNAERVAETFARASGDTSTESVIAVMRAHFSDDEAREEERVAAALRSESPGPLKERETSSGRAKVLELEDTVVAAPATRPAGLSFGRGSLAIALVALVALSGVIGWSFLRHEPETSTESAPVTAEDLPVDVDERASDRAETPRAESPELQAPTRETIEVGVDPRARLVLVDGVRHEERPLQLQLARDESREVVLVGARGEERFSVGVDDDGRQLSLRTRARVAMPSAKAPTMMRGPQLFDVDI